MALSTNTSVQLPAGETVLGIFPGGTQDYTGSWIGGRTGLETWLNTGGAAGHRFKMLHAIVGNSWSNGSYYNSRGMMQGLPPDVQPLISIPSMFPQFDPGTSTPATYAKALAGNYDSFTDSSGLPGGYDVVLQQIATDYQYCSLRIGQEIEGDWFWWGLTHTAGKAAASNGGTALQAAQLHTRLRGKLRTFGWKGTYEVNCGNYNGFNIASIIDNMAPADWDIAGTDSYFLGNTASQALDPAASWTNAIYPMIGNAIAMAKKYGKRWGMSEWSYVKYMDVASSAQTGAVDSRYYLQQLRALCLDSTLPECAYLSLFYGNDWSGSTLHRLDAMAVPRSITDGSVWTDRPEFPLGIAELKTANWTPAGLTRASAGGTTATGAAVTVITPTTRRSARGRRVVTIPTNRPAPVPPPVVAAGYGAAYGTTYGS